MECLRALRPVLPPRAAEDAEEQARGVYMLLHALQKSINTGRAAYPGAAYALTGHLDYVHPEVLEALLANGWHVYTFAAPDPRHMHALLISFVPSRQLAHINPHNFERLLPPLGVAAA
jgi:hypothetical protein